MPTSVTTNKHTAPKTALSIRDRLCITLFAAAVLLPGVFNVSLTDRDEGWYAQISRQMLTTGDWLIPHYLDQPWLGKPPLLFWCTASSFALLGTTAWAGRLVSVAASLVVTHLLASFGVELGSRRTAWFASLGYLTAMLPVFVGKLLLTDALLLMWSTAAMWLLWRMLTRHPTWSRGIALWTCVGLGLLTKGPAIAIFLLGFLVALFFHGGLRRQLLNPSIWLTAPLALLIALPWYLYIDHAAGHTLRSQFLGYEIISRFTAPPHGHVGPPGYYFLVLLLGWLPWTVLLPGAVAETWQTRRSDPHARLLLVWFALPWLLLELVPGKLPHYILPACIPLALMFGRMWNAGIQRTPTTLQRLVLACWALLTIAVGFTLCALGWLANDPNIRSTLFAAGIALCVGFIIVGVVAVRGTLLRSFIVATITTVAFHIAFGALFLPTLEPYRLSRNIANVANSVAPPHTPIIAAGYDEPTMFFYLDLPATCVHQDGLAAALANAPNTLIIAREDWLDELNVDPAAPGTPWHRVAGFNYAKGDHTVVWIRPPTHTD